MEMKLPKRCWWIERKGYYKRNRQRGGPDIIQVRDHDLINIYGTPEAITALRDACTRALENADASLTLQNAIGDKEAVNIRVRI